MWIGLAEEGTRKTIKPALLMIRRLAEPIQVRAPHHHDAGVNDADDVFSPDKLIARYQHVDAVLPCHSEQFSAAVTAALPARMRIIANHSVGTDHVDLAAATARGSS